MVIFKMNFSSVYLVIWGTLLFLVYPFQCIQNLNPAQNISPERNNSDDIELGDESVQKDFVVDPRFGGGFNIDSEIISNENESLGNKKNKKPKNKVKGDCGVLTTPMNSASVCMNLESCQVTCSEGFMTESGDESLTYLCKNGHWTNAKSGKPIIEKCKPKCQPACQNGGKCAMPNICQCPLNYYGPLCEFEKIPCSVLPKPPLFTFRKCDSESCTLSCMPGKKFPDGSSSVDLSCQNGKWIPSRTDWSTIPDCRPTCNPTCMNGGKCIDTDVCFCPKDYRGEICQYPVSVCDISKLNFNGNYNCSGDESQYSCELSCPAGMTPKIKFQSKYTCLYSEGKFTPADAPQCEIGRIIEGVKFNQYESKLLSLTPVPTTCMLWGPYHFKTFNGKLINFKGECLYTLVRDDLENLFQIQLDLKNNEIRNIIIYINNEKYLLSRTGENKPSLIVENSGQQISIPSQLVDLKVEVASGKTILIYLPAANLYLVWNVKNELQIDMGVEFWNRTSGLCGKGSNPLGPFNLLEHVNKAVVSSITDKCDSPIREEKQCARMDAIGAKRICSKLSTDSVFRHCLNKLPVKEYMDACEWSFCNCDKANKMECVCQLFSKFAQLCNQLSAGVKINWRDRYNCSFSCPSEQVYTDCLPVSQATCVSEEIIPTGLQKFCEEGCVCPAGSVLHNETCIKKDTCPCMFQGKFYDPGSVLVKDCNKCSCNGGKWSCTNAICKAECVVLDPHFRTFDGKKYDFIGSCAYKLVTTRNISVEIDNSLCTNEIIKNNNGKQCVKSVIIRAHEKVIKLKDYQKVTLNDVELEQFPQVVDGSIFVRRASSFLTEVSLTNGLDVFWDSKNKLQILAEPSLFENTKGLCGVFNNNQNDDLLTPEGDLEQNPLAFANKWRAKENCETEKNFDGVSICEVNIQNKPIAESYCKNLTSSIFEECHSVISPQEYYEDCLSDLCSCTKSNLAECVCPIFSVYAHKCAKNGIIINWRDHIRECGIHCPTGQTYEMCGNTCRRSCGDISHKELCKESCVEGCYCPAGYTLNEDENCVPISECPCIYKNQKYSPKQIDFRNESSKLESCECKNAAWECRSATEEESEKYRHKTSCPSPNMEFVECEPPEPTTCRNMHDPPKFSEKTCYPGCVCKDGYVLESVSKQCVKRNECPCHHGGRSYFDGETMSEECNNCTCVRGAWECTKEECVGTCSSWGDSHFRTFDGKFYDFQGTCDYVFARGVISENFNFTVSIEIVPCGTGGTSCTNSVTLNVGIVDKVETLVMNKEKKDFVDAKFKNFEVVTTELYVFVIIPTLSITLQWDKGTRVSLKAHPRWKNKLSGLCGNYNGNSLDDFQTPSGGLVEVTPSVFADSWKLQQHCPLPPCIQDPCVLNAHRKFWAIEKCSFLKNSPVFKQCHSEVSVEDYYKRCVFDSCACDQGGDCECICTVFSAYAQECNNKGLPLKWRTQELCPIQCPAGKEYSPCINPCPADTCESINANNTISKECQQLHCVEGCQKKTCPPGKIFKNSTTDECVTPMDCECITVDGTVYKENEKIKEDDCSSCFCSKGQMVCSGLPCNTDFTPPSLVSSEKPMLTSTICSNGWSDWISIQRPFSGKLNLSNLSFENTNDRLNCFPELIKNITCRSKTYSSSEFQEMKCNLNEAIQCQDDCYQFQVKLYCKCDDHHEKTEVLEVQNPPQVETVCKEGWSEWMDVSTPSINKNNGEFETFNSLQEQDIVVCPLGYVANIECKFRNSTSQKRNNKWAMKLKKPKFVSSLSNLADWRSSNEEDITCNTEVGFVCSNEKQKSGICNDYQIRVLCSCTPVTTSQIPISKSTCPPGTEWSECKINCNKLCGYYKYQLENEGLCVKPEKCIPGCVNKTCPDGEFWRDENTCVRPEECTCATSNGSLAKPGAITFEDSCTTCQCINNENVCSLPRCGTTEIPKKISTPYWEFEHTFTTVPYPSTYYETSTQITTEFVTPPATLTPLPKCSFQGFVAIDQQANYNASSSKSDQETPEKAKLIISGENIQNNNSWKPLASDAQPYLEIDLGYVQPIYGINVAGNPLKQEWVKSFKVLYSSDGESYSQAYNADNSEIFRGPYDHSHATQQTFNSAVEARYLRIKPISWENEIALLINVFGCSMSSTTIYTPVVCSEPMGIESGRMYPQQITTSSNLNDNFKPSDLSLSSSSGWLPLIASSEQWIQIDFTSERIIEGIVTKGNSIPILKGNAWIEAFKIRYSLDGVNWSPVLNEDKTEKIFPANIDHLSAHTNTFTPPLRTRYLRLYPVKWMNFPALRMEVLGCFEPYLAFEPVVVEVPTTPSACKTCSGIQEVYCNCDNNTYWSGSACVEKEMCPCVEGLLSYSVGSTYVKNTCEKCTCALGGNALCTLAVKKNCDDCNEKGLLRIVEDDCNCRCEKCPRETLLCPTTNFCLNETLWCNGYKECPDDESGCDFTTVANVVTESSVVYESTTTIPVTDTCPPVTCPSGYIAETSVSKSNTIRGILKNIKSKQTLKTSSFHEVVGSISKDHAFISEVAVKVETIHSHLKPSNIADYVHQQQMQFESTENLKCQDWICVPTGSSCAKPECPMNTKLTSKWTGDSCPAYECIVLPPNEKECSVNGKMITTFDGLSYIYDICDHILAEDKVYGIWKIRKTNRCPLVGLCVTSLIVNLGNDTIEIFTNFTAHFNGYSYTIPQLQAIGSKSNIFVLQEVSDNFIIFANTDLKFSIVWGNTGTVKLIVDSSLHGMIDGLCGYFDFNIDNDKTKPDGTIVLSSQEFGDSWNSSTEPCEIKSCPKDIQIKTGEICNVFRTEPFNVCGLTMKLDDYVAKCVESLCTCANSASKFDEECRCQVLENFASKCLSLQSGVDISSWRIKYDCPVNCTAPFVYHECYNRQCEPSCDSLLEKDQCPQIENKCFPGCYCPDGLVRKGNSCLKPTECRDCACNGNGIAQYTTFDQVEIPFDGSCSSYILLQMKSTKDENSELKVILTNAPCVNPHLKGVCPHGITVIANKKEILLAQSENDLNKVKVKLDNVTITTFPHVTDFLKITESPGISAKLSIPSMQLDVIFMSHNRGFFVELPSHLYSDTLEGLCGSCNRDQTDDIKEPSGEIANSFKEFLKSWRTEYSADNEKRNCSQVSQQVSSFENFTIQCAAPPENDPCLLFLNEELFGQCHPIVDPIKYVDLCHNFSCNGIDHCYALESYAQECQKNGICSEWRSANLCPYVCPEGFEYEACSIGCEVTCENYQVFKEDRSVCSEPFMEKCVCPSGQVLSNGICVNEVRCRPCDKNDHYIGDKWQPDICSLCECLEDGSIRCEKKQCAGDIICPLGFQAEIDNNNDDPCCIKHICVAEFALNCSEPIKPVCGKDQFIKMEITANNCTEYICTCIPREECPSIDNSEDIELLPGMIRVEKKEGCCPSIDITCDANTCPESLRCPPFFVLHEIKNSHACCPEYKCELPPNTCIHEYEWIAEYNGTTRKRLPSEIYKELKQVGDSWFDGPCKQCSCSDGLPHAICNTMICEEPPETKSFVMEPVYHFGTCCPSYKRVACKINDLIYEVGSSWNVESDPCKTMSCVLNEETQEISIQQTIQLCNITCGIGEKYVDSSNKDICCGRCVQEACVDEKHILHYPQTNWTSENGCIKYECTPEFQIIASAETCMNITGCPEELISRDGCCPKCMQTPYSSVNNCEAVSMPLNDTIKIINKLDALHGPCTNPDQIYGFTKCNGQCNTFAYYDIETTKYANTCECCAGISYEIKKVVLTCEDGYSFIEDVKIPVQCTCRSCSDQQIPKNIRR